MDARRRARPRRSRRHAGDCRPEQAGIKIEPWDYRYYAEKVRKDKYDLDQNEVKPYLQLEKLREGDVLGGGRAVRLRVHAAVTEQSRSTTPTCASSEVTRSRRASRSGLWYFDPYARPGKQFGCLDELVPQRRSASTSDITTIVSNNSNFVKGKPGEPVLISWDDAATLFHEFGHALHGLCSNVTYPSLAALPSPATTSSSLPSCSSTGCRRRRC